MAQIAYQCKDVVFHFNKKHLEDSTVPMWVVKSHGVTFYVNHVDAEIPWTTKETPDNSHTKGSLKFKQCKLVIDDDNCATLSKLGLLDRNLPHPRLIHRIIFKESSKLHLALHRDEYEHTKFKYLAGSGCGTSWVVCDILKEEDLTIIGLMYPDTFRILSPNESYYKAYEQEGVWIDEYDEDEDEDDE